MAIGQRIYRSFVRQLLNLGKLKLLILLLCGFSSFLLPSCFLQADGSISTIDAVAFPHDANMISVQKYGAKGDGITDDTEAIRQAVRDNLTQHRTLFFSAGTYLVSESIEWIGEDNLFGAFLTWQGEGTGKTTIKLQDKTSGFGDRNFPQPIVRVGSLGTGGNGAGNRAHNNYIFDMTFNVGKNNPGAVGVDFNASNTGAMENVKIVSDDGQGAAGLDLTREVGSCLIKNVSITGFDIGIKSASALYNITLENIKLENQNVVGIDNKDIVLSIRKLTSDNSVPAIINSGDWPGPLVLIDSELRGGSLDTVAIKNSSNILVRNVKVQGYKAAIESGDRLITDSTVKEFISTAPISLFDSPPQTLDLPIKETPTFVDNDLTHWANVEDYGAKRDDDQDDSKGIQKAIDSGKATIYFPYGNYHVDKTIKIQGKVRRIIGFNSWINSYGVPFRFENKTYPVIFERFNFTDSQPGKNFVEQAALQPVVIKHSIGPTIVTTSKTSTLFIENVITQPVNVFQGQELYARQLNSEKPPPEPILKNDGGLVWLLGYKTEQGNTVASTLHHGKTEILGGLFYPAQGVEDPNMPVLFNQDSSVSAVYREIAFGSSYTTQIQEIRKGKSATLMSDDVRKGNMVGIPLYVGYEP